MNFNSQCSQQFSNSFQSACIQDPINTFYRYNNTTITTGQNMNDSYISGVIPLYCHQLKIDSQKTQIRTIRRVPPCQGASLTREMTSVTLSHLLTAGTNLLSVPKCQLSQRDLHPSHPILTLPQPHCKCLRSSQGWIQDFRKGLGGCQGNF